MKKFLALLFFLFISAASADESISVCYNYSCHNEATANFSEAQLRTLAKKLRSARSATEERQALADSMGKLYYWAGQQTPIYADKGGNTFDDAVNGSMDCIDHSTTTTRFLNMLDRRKMLRYHKVEDVARRNRFFVFDHFSAVIEELPHPLLPKPSEEILNVPDEVKPHRYVVDSWFVNNGKPAVILPLEEWLGGAGPRAEPNGSPKS